MPDRISRRMWLGRSLAVAAAGWPTVITQSDSESDILNAVDQRRRAAGLGPFQQFESPLYIGTGDAPRSFQETALRLCEDLAEDWLGHFGRRGLPAARPMRRLVVVILADPKRLAAFLSLEPDPELRGLYDLEADWLAICDNRGDGSPRAERANSIALHHEATHQLCFHCGLLEPRADVPLAISEGLAVYGEVRRPGGRTPVGALNAERLAVLNTAARSGQTLIPMRRLVVEDRLFADPETRQLAYAQAWLLIHWLMQQRPRQARLATYLDTLRHRQDASQRLEDLTAHLGDAELLDADLKRYANRLLRR
ncbi:MAG: hypothetical protein KatS3mg108_1903 [Isosphaeraceae bacterium]|jgi:hypothetical protein|nr:MAG: hypothetical protein KatS3mg108_1903 [Isosphaeraceae bacterium]